jgi:hypothetical protein
MPEVPVSVAPRLSDYPNPNTHHEREPPRQQQQSLLFPSEAQLACPCFKKAAQKHAEVEKSWKLKFLREE